MRFKSTVGDLAYAARVPFVPYFTDTIPFCSFMGQFLFRECLGLSYFLYFIIYFIVRNVEIIDISKEVGCPVPDLAILQPLRKF